MTKSNIEDKVIKIMEYASPIIIIAGIILAIISVITVVGEYRDNEVSLGRHCNGFIKADAGYDCCKSCKELDKEYFKHKYQDNLIASDVNECYCQQNNTIEKIW